MVPWKNAIKSFTIGIILTGCQGTYVNEQLPKLETPERNLNLEPVQFKVVLQDDNVYYALDNKNYINLGLNMLRIQQLIYEMAVWEKLNYEGSEDTQDNGDINSKE